MNQIAMRAVVSRYQNHLELILGWLPLQEEHLGQEVKLKLLREIVIQ